MSRKARWPGGWATNQAPASSVLVVEKQAEREEALCLAAEPGGNTLWGPALPGDYWTPRLQRAKLNRPHTVSDAYSPAPQPETAALHLRLRRASNQLLLGAFPPGK